MKCLVMLSGCTSDDAEVMRATLAVELSEHPLSGVLVCRACSDHIFRRDRTLEADFVRMAHALGILRTQMALIKMGIVTVK